MLARTDVQVSVAVRGVSKAYGNGPVVDNVSLSVTPGTCFGLLGPNGAGKSTTLKIIYGYVRPDAGEVRVAGLDMLRAPRAAKRLIGVIPQDDTLDPDLTVLQNLHFCARYFGMGAGAAPAAQRHLEEAGLSEYRDAMLGELSSGLRRRLVLARALLTEPRILVLDEPTRGLDRSSREQFLERLVEMKQRGVALLLATHELEEAEALCDQAGIMDGGRIVQRGAAEDVLALARGRHLLDSALEGGGC